MLVLAESAEDGVGRRAYAALQGQELLGDTALVQFVDQELGGEVAYTVGHRVAVLEGAGLVGDVTFYDTHHLVLGNRDVGNADTVADVEDGNGLAVRGVQRLVDVVEILGVGAVERVQLEDDLLGQTGSRGADTAGGGQVDVIVVAAVLDVADLKDGPVHVAVETVAQLLCHVAQVQVVVGNLAHVDMLAEVGVGGVGGTVEDSLRVGQVAVGALSGRGTSKDGHLELAASLMLGHRNLC